MYDGATLQIAPVRTDGSLGAWSVQDTVSGARKHATILTPASLARGRQLLTVFFPPVELEVLVRVTYIVAAYNAEKTIGRAVNSVLDQVGASVDVIVVDDASTDGTVQVARSVRDDRVRVVELPVNGGPGRARNVGIGLATGDWVGILDADDALLPGRTLTVMSRASETGSEAIVDNMRRTPDESSPPLYQRHPFVESSLLTLADFVDGNLLLRTRGPSLGFLKPVVRRDFLSRHSISYPEELRIAEDFYFLAAILSCHGPVPTCRESGYIYADQPGSLSSRLELADVRQIRDAEPRFCSEVLLDLPAKRAFDRRASSIRSALHYLELTSAVRNRQIASASSLIARDPFVLLHARHSARYRFRAIAEYASERWLRLAASSARL